MDEPFGALDPGTREAMQMLLLEIWERTRMTIFFVTHDLEEAAFLGTRILVLSQYYTHEQANGDGRRFGARIVHDTQLPRIALSTEVKATAGFGELIQRIRREGFDPDYLQHVREFDLAHPDSFMTPVTGGDLGNA
jgi:NitT/TauT family transport system ATP-binding protein